MSSWVIDASVGIQWLVPEIHSEAAQNFLTSEQILLVPDLFFPEIGNILWKRVRRGEDTAEKAEATLADFSLLPLVIYASQPLTPAALTIALQTGRTVDDSLYLALAIATACSLVTADLKLYNSLQNTSYKNSIQWVEEAIR